MANTDIARILTEIADYLEIDGANIFRVRAYRNAARVISALSTDVGTMIDNGDDLTALPGIGKDLSYIITKLARSGKSPDLAKLKRKLGPQLGELLSIPGLGAKKVKLLSQELNIKTVKQLLTQAKAGKVRALPGFGAKSEKQIIEALETKRQLSGRIPYAVAEHYAEPLAEYLRQSPYAKHVEIAGSFRRHRETIGDIDILVSASNPKAVIEHFVKYGQVDKIIGKGPTKATVILKAGLQIDLRVVKPESYGAALVYFTGSQAHNVKLRKLGQKRKLKVNEYGVFSGNKRIAGKTEQSVYKSLGLTYIEPALREDSGEIEAILSKPSR